MKSVKWENLITIPFQMQIFPIPNTLSQQSFVYLTIHLLRYFINSSIDHINFPSNPYFLKTFPLV